MNHFVAVLRALLVSAPQEIRERLLKTKTAECVASCARLRSLGNPPMLQTLTTTLRLLAKRWLALAEELNTLDAMLDRLTASTLAGFVTDSVLAHRPLQCLSPSQATIPNA